MTQATETTVTTVLDLPEPLSLWLRGEAKKHGRNYRHYVIGLLADLKANAERTAADAKPG